MDINGLNAALGMVIGVFALIGCANLVDFSFRRMAEDKALRAEGARFRKWGLPAPVAVEPPKNDEHLWHI
jgi:hypothetical protein